MMTATTNIALGRRVQEVRPEVLTPFEDVSRPTITPEAERVSRWDRIIRKMHAMFLLGDDWDGMGAKAPSRDIVFAALELACGLREVYDYPAPTRVAPTPAGTIGLEWQEPSIYTEAEIVASGRSEWMQIKDEEQPVHWTYGGISDIGSMLFNAPTPAGTIGLEWWPDPVGSPF
jgi:hypothetical protein